MEASLSLLHHKVLALKHVGAAETDERTRGERATASSNAVHKMEEHALHDFPIQGPRTTHWLQMKMARSELGPVPRHHWWRQAMGLTESDIAVDEHLFLCEMLGQVLATGHVGSLETDVRTLPVPLNPRGKRACASSDAVHKMEEHALHDFPIQGPRTTRWLLLEIARGELGPVARHHWWRQAMGLSSSDPGVDEHLFLCELLGHGSKYDQLNLSDRALDEAVSRRLQLWEERHAEKLRASRLAVLLRVYAGERHLFLGGSRPKEARWRPQN